MLVDSHCHLDFPDFEGERDEIVARARRAGVTRMVTISTKLREFERIERIIDHYPCVYGTVGTHPHHAGLERDVRLDELVRLAGHQKIIAIGEAGLDYHYTHAPVDDQKAVFQRHIEAARRTGLPLVIHARAADEDMITILRQEFAAGPFHAVLHCFSSQAGLARAGIELGFYISFSGILTFRKSTQLRAIAAALPLDRLLVETDAPYLAPHPHRGTRNEPSMVVHVNAVLATLHGKSAEFMARQTSDNFTACFPKCAQATDRCGRKEV